MMNFSPASSSSNPNQDEQNPPVLLSTDNHPSNPNLYHNPNLNSNAPHPNYHHNNPDPASDNAAWNFAEDKEFERLIVESSQWDELTRWERIAAQLGGGRTAAEVEEHYQKLVHDVELIESGLVPFPSYNDDDDGSLWCVNAFMEELGEADRENFDKPTSSTPPSGGKQVGRAPKKGAKWTDDEHRLFLIGLKKYRKGDWRSISRYIVTTRCPSQVASHAQKFFNRLKGGPKAQKRSSIHDITNVDSDSLADLFRRGLIDASNVDDDSLADLIRQGLVTPGSTSTAAQPAVAGIMHPSHNISPDHALGRLHLDAHTTSTYISMDLGHGADISPNQGWGSLQVSPDMSPHHPWTSLQASPNTYPNHVLGDEQNTAGANTLQPTSYVSSNHVLVNQQNPNASTSQPASYISSDEMLAILQSNPTIDPRFHLPQHFDYYKQL